MESAQRFFKQAVAVVGHVPDQVTTDGHSSYPRQFVRQWAAMRTIERANISTIDWSKTTMESNNATLRCAALEPLKERHAFVVKRDELRNYLRPHYTLGERSLSWNNDGFFSSILPLSRQ